MKKGHNFLRWSSPELDALLARGLLAKVQAERKPIYDRAQEIVAEASPAINLYHREVVYAFKATLKGIKPGSSSFFWNAEEWGY
jgi:peptide/nickel transport system substrate-binding protein